MTKHIPDRNKCILSPSLEHFHTAFLWSPVAHGVLWAKLDLAFSMSRHATKHTSKFVSILVLFAGAWFNREIGLFNILTCSFKLDVSPNLASTVHPKLIKLVQWECFHTTSMSTYIQLRIPRLVPVPDPAFKSQRLICSYFFPPKQLLYCVRLCSF